MEESKPLRETLESLSQVYHTEKVSVQFGSPPRAIPRGHSFDGEEVTEPTVVINPDVQQRFGQELTGPEELRCITNTLSHELEHIRESDLTSKAEFMEEYGQHPQFAGAIINILEDQYIDFIRTQRFPGLRSTQAFVVDKLLQDDDQWPPIHEIEETSDAMIEGVRQLSFAGHAKGISEVEDWLREFLSRTRPHIKRVRRERDQQQRKEIAHSVMEIALTYLPENESFELPETCTVCEEREPVIEAPLLGPVCEECAPTGHGKRDGARSGLRTGENDNQKVTAEAIEGLKTEDKQESNPLGETGEEGNKGSSQNEGQFTGEESDELATMDELDKTRNSGSWWNVPEDTNHQTVRDEDVRRFEQIQEEKENSQSLEVDLRQSREDYLESDGGLYELHPEHSESLQKSDDWRRLRDEYRRSFRQLTSRDMPVPSKQGSRLNMDNIIQRAAGDKSQDRLYNRKQRVAKGDRVVAVSADISGSMEGKQVKLALAAIAEATEMVGDEFIATCWTSMPPDILKKIKESKYNQILEKIPDACGHQRGASRIGLICGKDERFQWNNLDAFRTVGGTPTADGVDVTRKLLANVTAREKLIIVITDGEPTVEYGAEDITLTGDEVRDAAQIVEKTRTADIKVIGLYVGDEIEDSSMSEIFGESGFVSTSMEDLAEELVTIYRHQLNI